MSPAAAVYREPWDADATFKALSALLRPLWALSEQVSVANLGVAAVPRLEAVACSESVLYATEDEDFDPSDAYEPGDPKGFADQWIDYVDWKRKADKENGPDPDDPALD